MNLIELHIIQSFPVTCLNRDDLGSPKSAVFGGVQRARVSSQCWKRAIRESAREIAKAEGSASFNGIRTRALKKQFKDAFAIELGDKIDCDKIADSLADSVLAIKAGKDKLLFGKTGEGELVETLFYCSPAAISAIVKLVVGEYLNDAKFDPAKRKSDIIKLLEGGVSDAADIALFGRMVAADSSLTVEGAAMFSHALSTHSVRNDLDFFSAVDDAKVDSDDAGAGHIGTTEFNSACYYRYIGVNVDLLKQSKLFNQDELKVVLANFLRACVTANPTARRNAMFGYTLPSCVLALKRQGQPLSLANAFEKPIKAGKNGIVEESVTAMKGEWESLKKTFGLSAEEVSVAKDGASLDEMIEKMLEGIA